MTAGFKAWLRLQRHRHDPVGDLARDACADNLWPRGRARLQTLHDHLARMGAIPEAHDALDRAWFEWNARSTSTTTAPALRRQEGARMTDYCIVCGAAAHEVGPQAGSWSICALIDDDEGWDWHGDDWELEACLDLALTDAESAAWRADVKRRVEAGELPACDPPPALVEAIERLRAEFDLPTTEPPAA